MVAYSAKKFIGPLLATDIFERFFKMQSSTEMHDKKCKWNPNL